MLVSGRFDDDLFFEGKMILAYAESTQGCGYKAQGHISSGRFKVFPDSLNSSLRQPLSLEWGKHTYEGTVETSDRLTENASVEVLFKSLSGNLSCIGSLRTDEHMAGAWNVKCSDGNRASGKYFQSDSSWSLSGRDLNGNPVTAFVSL